MILGVPPGGWGVGGWGGVGVVRGCPSHMCTCTHMHARMHAHAYDIIGNSQGFPKIQWMAAICMKLSCLPRARVHVCACACVWAPPTTYPHGATPQTCPQPPTTHPPTPTPRAAGSPKHQNSISLELIEIIRFCLKILYL